MPLNIITMSFNYAGVAETIMDKCVHLKFNEHENQNKKSGKQFKYKNLDAITMKYDLISMDR